MFKRYQHIERFGTEEVLDIELGISYIFPKIDDTNGSVWYENGTIHAGSRNRELSVENDNANFFQYITNDERIKNFFNEFPQYRLFGEWLVPHSLKTYKSTAWKKFYIFDVCIDKENSMDYISYDNYKEKLEKYNLDYIPCIAKIKNGSYENFISWLNKNVFLIEDGNGYAKVLLLKIIIFIINMEDKLGLK